MSDTEGSPASTLLEEDERAARYLERIINALTDERERAHSGCG